MRSRRISESHPAFGRLVAAAAAATAVAVSPVGEPFVEPASAAPTRAPETPSSPAEAQAVLVAARSSRLAAEQRYAELAGRLDAMDAELTRRFADAAELAADLEAARSAMRQAAVVAYVQGDTDPVLGALTGEDVDAASRRSVYSQSRTRDWADASAAYEQLKADNDPQLVALADRREALRSRVADARDAVFQSAAVEAEAERASEAAARAEAARAAAAKAEAERAAAAGAAASRRAAAAPSGPAVVSAPPPSPSGVPSPAIVILPGVSAPLPAVPPGGPSEAAWAQLRKCESGGNYRAVSRSGRYRGAYQFDQRTWESLGGRGDPAGAPPEEQDARAKLLYSQRGARPWPVCGRALI